MGPILNLEGMIWGSQISNMGPAGTSMGPVDTNDGYAGTNMGPADHQLGAL